MIRVNETLCVLCGTCVGVCPADALTLEMDSLRIREEKCVSCGSCVTVCPVGALTGE